MQIDHDCCGWHMVDISILHNSILNPQMTLDWSKLGLNMSCKRTKSKLVLNAMHLTLGLFPLELRGFDCGLSLHCTAHKIHLTLHGQKQKQGFLCVYWKLRWPEYKWEHKARNSLIGLSALALAARVNFLCKESRNTSTICFYAFAAFRLSSFVSFQLLFEFSTVWRNCHVPKAVRARVVFSVS